MKFVAHEEDKLIKIKDGQQQQQSATEERYVSGHKKAVKLKAKMEDFIGIFPNVISEEVCNDLIKWFDMCSEHGLTMSSAEEKNDYKLSSQRKDELIFIPQSLPDVSFPDKLLKEVWGSLQKCYEQYYEQYSIDCDLTSYSWKMHRVKPTGGFHAWHHEHSYGRYATRVLVWMIILEAPEEGGETEFLHQSLRIEPIPKQLLIWPAAFTHKHRGNPPLKGEKTYITGWFDVIIPPAETLAF